VLVATAAGGIVVAASTAVLVVSARVANLEAARLEARRGARSVTTVLRAELESVAPSAGDIRALAASSLVLRGQRGFGLACAVDTVGRVLLLAAAWYTALRQADTAGDSLLVFHEGDGGTREDDGWLTTSVRGQRIGSCPGGAAAVALDVAATPAELAGVAPGAPVRLFETVEYRTYRDGEGLWWLGVRTVGAAGWSTISPVAGPLRGERGLRLQAWDGAGAPAGATTGIVLVEAVAVARAARAPGGRAVEDSSVMRLAIGGR
jgi:hypothetical protein